MEGNFFDLNFSNSDIDSKFKGFHSENIVPLDVEAFAQANAGQLPRDRDFPRNLQLNWFYDRIKPQVTLFITDGESGLHAWVNANVLPLDYFNLFMKNTELEQITSETN